jgi:DNA-binding NarL/FixJ family response regulator
MDLTIPGGMGGKETISRLKAIDPEVKAIVSSGYSDNPVIANCQTYGFAGAVAKPYNLNELGKVLHKVMS